MSTPAVGLRELLQARFYKMSGSGNDFVFVDARAGGPEHPVRPDTVAEICARGSGVGADGLVVLDQPGPGHVRIVYYNGDGSRASLCGNATLCAANLAVHLGAVAPSVPFTVETDAGVFPAEVSPGVGPSFTLGEVRSVQAETSDRLAGEDGAAEQRIGYAVAGVPHVVVRVTDVGEVALGNRSPELRRAIPGRPDGANVNFVSPTAGGRWRMRTFERGVEGETLACGTGAVACASLLRAWGEAGDCVELETRSGRILTVTLDPARGVPRLAGEGRLVFVGALA